MPDDIPRDEISDAVHWTGHVDPTTSQAVREATLKTGASAGATVSDANAFALGVAAGRAMAVESRTARRTVKSA